MKSSIIVLFFIMPALSKLYTCDVGNCSVGECHRVNIDPTTKKGDLETMTQIIAGLFLCFSGLMLYISAACLIKSFDLKKKS